MNHPNHDHELNHRNFSPAFGVQILFKIISKLSDDMGRANPGVPIMYNLQIITIQSQEIMTGCGLSLYSLEIIN